MTALTAVLTTARPVTGAAVKPAQPVDWESIAVRVALAEGSFHRLSTRERDILETAMDAAEAAERENR